MQISILFTIPKVDGNHQYKLSKLGRKKYKLNLVVYRQKKNIFMALNAEIVCF